MSSPCRALRTSQPRALLCLAPYRRLAEVGIDMTSTAAGLFYAGSSIRVSPVGDERGIRRGARYRGHGQYRDRDLSRPLISS
jgi:hypothetical protein